MVDSLDNNAKPGRAVGYVRTKIYKRNILCKTLIDSGNLFGDLISEKFAKLLNLPIFGSQRTVGTASAKGSVTIMGKTKPIFVYLEGIHGHCQIEPYVVKDLAHCLNLGETFLRRNNADLTFRMNGVQLRIRNSCAMLASSDKSLTHKSIDSRISKLLDDYMLQGCNPHVEADDFIDLRINTLPDNSEITGNSEIEFVPGVQYQNNKKNIDFDPTLHPVKCAHKTVIKPSSTVVITANINYQSNKAQNDVHIFPKRNNKFLNAHELFVHPGVYIRNGNVIKLMVTNFSQDEKYIPANCLLGQLMEAVSYASSKSLVNELDHQDIANLTSAQIQERKEYITTQLNINNNKMLMNNPLLRKKIIDMFMENWDAIAISEYDYGRTDLLKFSINIPKDAIPVRDKLRPLNPHQEEDLSRQIDAWLKADVIEPAMSPWASALVAVKKKNTNQYRWAIDYRKVNALTIKDAFPLANIETNLNKLNGAAIFSTLDSAGAFHSVQIDPEYRDYTAFVTPRGQYRFCRLPFGLANAPSCYSRLVQMALDRLPSGFCLGYIDDIICYSTSLEDHISHLQQVVQLHVQCGMKLNLRKCNIFRSEVEYLGHLVNKDGIRMVPSYIQRILDWPVPKNGKELRSFLGFCNYYRIFISKFAELTFQLNKLKGSKNIEWTSSTLDDFNELKACFAKEPVRGYPQYQNPEPFILDTDFSSKAMAAVLSQKQNGREKLIGCATKGCNKAEASYPSWKGELRALMLGLKKFEHILRARKFVIRTDSKPVEHLKSIKEHRGMLCRWNLFIGSFDFESQHRAGSKHINADALSRLSHQPIEEELENDPNEPYHDVDDIYHITNETQQIERKTFVEEIDTDPVLNTIRTLVMEGTKPDKEGRKNLGSIGNSYVNIFECLKVHDGVLYYQDPILNGVTPPARICLPFSLQDTAFKLCHTDGIVGHFGMNKTYEKMRQRFYFPHMQAYIVAKINNCIPCFRKRSTCPKPDHKMHREVTSYFNQKVFIDFVGPLSPCRYNGVVCKYILTMLDGFTRYLVAVPVEDQTAETLANAIIANWIYSYGCCETLHSDRGASFTSKLFLKVMNGLGITKTITPPYTPQGNRVERCHKVLGAVLRADQRFDPARWAQKLPAIVLAYNTTTNRTTGQTPFYAVFGYHIKLPVDIIFPFPHDDRTKWSAHVENFRSKMARITKAMCEHQKTVFLRENRNFQGREEDRLKIGDTVYYFLASIPRNISKKLSSRYIGPFQIKKIISESLVVIYPIGTWNHRPRDIPAVVNRIKKVDMNYVTHADLKLDEQDLKELHASLALPDDASVLDFGASENAYQRPLEMHTYAPSNSQNEEDDTLEEPIMYDTDSELDEPPNPMEPAIISAPATNPDINQPVATPVVSNQEILEPNNTNSSQSTPRPARLMAANKIRTLFRNSGREK
ncbi:MAG: reverse transcriptase domain-containing protein [Paracoccaceae bacterium]